MRIGVKREALQRGAATLAGRGFVTRGERQAALDGGYLEHLEGILGVGVLVQSAEALEQTHHPPGDGAQERLHLLILGWRQGKEGGPCLRLRRGSGEQPLRDEHVEVGVGL